VSHANATLTPRGRLLLARCVVIDRWPLRRAAERFGVSQTTAQRWANRFRQLGEAGMSGRSSRPHHSPRRTPTRVERRILGLRVALRWGPARIAFRLGLAVSTVGRVLRRYGAPPLRFTDPATGTRIRSSRPAPVRYEREAPGELVHMDVKKLGRIPDGGGHRVHGRAAARPIKKSAKPGYAYLHHAIDDHSRLAYSEILADERKETVVAFWTRATAWFADRGVTVQRVSRPGFSGGSELTRRR
jgi:transposase